MSEPIAHVIRHGRSVWNEVGRWQGQADVPLCNVGRAQAVQAAVGLPRFGSIVSSDLRRANETAQIIARECGLDPGHIVLDARLRERDIGSWVGLTTDEVEARWPNYLERGEVAADSEPPDALDQRVLNALLDILNRDGPPALVVVHRGVLASVLRLAGARPTASDNLEGWTVRPHGRTGLRVVGALRAT
jgi:glucosyl-3-phosphoglycerate phosphatase